LTAGPKRMAAADRREQIIKVTLRVVARHGVQDATNARIAKAAGISEKMLYVHFGSRKKLLIAALNAAFDQAASVLDGGDDTSAVDRLRAAGKAKWGTLTRAKDGNGFVYPLYEFLATPPEAGFRDHVLAKQQAVLDRFTEIIEQGIQEGTVRPDVDSTQVAWELLAIFMSQDLWYLSGFDESRSTGRSAVMLERLLRDSSVESSLSGETFSD
jgi:AcrR family transcriptional regulator